MTTPTIQEQLAAARREVAMRRRVYPRWVESGRMSQHTADHEMACMVAIVETLRGLVPPEPKQGDLL